MKVLVACEFSGRVRDAFISRGHEAMSADFLPTEAPGPHFQGDVREVLGEAWDLLIAHPSCQFLAVSGARYMAARVEQTKKALEFVRMFLTAKVPRIVVENPVSVISTRLRPPDQIIHPHFFGENASKSTCLWLKNLPLLVPTSHFPPRIIDGKKRWGNQTDSGQNRLGPSDTRAKERSTTYRGIAEAMAEQYGNPTALFQKQIEW
jgi:hypothetical protein